jgi:CRP-like cAMP-binding protein
MDATHLLDQATFFKDISRENKRALARICVPVEARKKEVIFREGDQGHSIYLLVKGHIRLHKTAGDGRETVIKIVQPGETFAEAILFEETRYPVTSVAITSAVLLKILKRDLHQLLNSEDFRNDFIAMLFRKQRYLAERVRQMSSQDVEERFFLFLREHFGEKTEIETAISKKEFAAVIGTTPETFSRLIRRLTKERKLSWRGKKLVLNVQVGRTEKSS